MFSYVIFFSVLFEKETYFFFNNLELIFAFKTIINLNLNYHLIFNVFIIPV